jgi:DNA-binding response OmpR family regulator
MDDAVLLIQTDDVIRRHLTTLIVENGYPCRAAADLRAGMDQLRSHPCRVVVLDLDLPCASAAALATHLRAAYPGICLVALDSAVESRGGAARDAHFDAVIPKPFVFDALLEFLAREASPALA